MADVGDILIPIDFLTEHASPASSIEIAGIRASNLLGIKRAIESSRKVMFHVPDDEGPSKAADFVGTNVSSEIVLEIRQTLVTAATALLRC